jgi:hypothetical protein
MNEVNTSDNNATFVLLDFYFELDDTRKAKILNEAASIGRIELLERCAMLGWYFCESLLNAAAANGALQSLKYLHQRGVEMSWRLDTMQQQTVN